MTSAHSNALREKKRQASIGKRGCARTHIAQVKGAGLRYAFDFFAAVACPSVLWARAPLVFKQEMRQAAGARKSAPGELDRLRLTCAALLPSNWLASQRRRSGGERPGQLRGNENKKLERTPGMFGLKSCCAQALKMVERLLAGSWFQNWGRFLTPIWGTTKGYKRSRTISSSPSLGVIFRPQNWNQQFFFQKQM